MSALADAVGVSSQMISRYERNDARPSLEIFQKIIQTLKFPISFFTLVDSFKYQDDGTFYRSRLTAIQSEKQASEIYKKAAGVVRDYFGEYIDFPRLDIDVQKGDTPRLAAQALREAWGLGDSPISNMVRLLEKHGVVVVFINSGSQRVDANSGYVSVNDHPYYIVLVDTISQSFYRLQFSLAHELGHLLLHADVLDPQELDAQEYRRMESEADEFASEFLLPAAKFRESLGTEKMSTDKYLSLKVTWHVAMSAMVYRARSLDILSANEYLKLQKRISYHKWRKVEPLDKKTPIPRPEVLHQSFDLLTKEGILDPSSLSSSLGRKYGVPYPNEILSQVIDVNPDQFSGEIVQLKSGSSYSNG
jgi:Zn-dependent peptidase ImmA (M78 family)/DNA-binding XRE family transcriptional regulator